MTDHVARNAHPELGDVRAAKSSDQADATAIHHKTEEGRLQSGSSRSRRLTPTSCHYHSCTDAPMPPSAHTDGLPSVWLPEGGKIHPPGPQTGQLGLLVQAGNRHLPDSSPTQGCGRGRQKWGERLSRVRVWGRHPVTPLVRREKWPTGEGTHRPWTGVNSLAGRSEIRGLGTGMGRGGGV